MKLRPYPFPPHTRRLLSKIVAMAVGVAALAAGQLFQQSRASVPARVSVRHVVDGDTVELSNGKRARYIGIDTPESRRQVDGEWIKTGDPFAEEAVRVNKALVLGKTVRLESDVQKEDKYKRLLVYCFVDQGGKEIMVQEEILRQGLAHLYTIPPNVKYVERLVVALQEAKKNRRGLWEVVSAIGSKDAGRYIGQRQIVEGVVRRSRATDKVVTLTMDGIKVVIFKSDLGLFQKEGIDPVVFYRDKRVRVFGYIKEYRGSPELIVSNPWQIEVL